MILETLTLLAALAGAPPAATLVVRVGPIEGHDGQIGCLLFASARGFPNDPNAAQARQSQPARGAYVTCTFSGLAAGDYAVAVMHDADGDGELDTNFVGIPSEGYGASNNDLPALSAPKFDASRVHIAAGETRNITIAVKY